MKQTVTVGTRVIQLTSMIRDLGDSIHTHVIQPTLMIQDLRVSAGTSVIQPTSLIRVFGVVLDQDGMTHHIVNVMSSCF